MVTCVPAVPVVGDTEETVGAVGTVTDVFAEVPPIVAVIVAVPIATPVNKPVVFPKTTEELDELHATDVVRSCVLPSEKVPLVVLSC